MISCATRTNSMHRNISIHQKENVVTDPSVIATTFNNFSLTTPSAVASTCFGLQMKLERNLHCKFIFPFTSVGMKRIIDMLKNKYSSGSDDLPEIIIKEFKWFMPYIFTDFINASFSLGIFSHHSENRIPYPSV